MSVHSVTSWIGCVPICVTMGVLLVELDVFSMCVTMGMLLWVCFFSSWIGCAAMCVTMCVTMGMLLVELEVFPMQALKEQC